MEGLIFYLISVIGLLFIIVGTTLLSSRKKNKMLWAYVFLFSGSIFLEIYSIYKEDIIFIILELIFMISLIYDVIKNEKNLFERHGKIKD